MRHPREGGSAFPRPASPGASAPSQSGMSVRQWFAGMVLPEVYRQKINDDFESSAECIAREAYEVADAMITEHLRRE